MANKKPSKLYLFLGYEWFHVITFSVLLLILILTIGFLSGMSRPEFLTAISIPITGLFAYFILILQLYDHYKKHLLEKNSMILSMLTELDHNTQLLIDCRNNFVETGAPRFIERVKSDKKISLEEKTEVKTILSHLKKDKIADECDTVGQAINKLERIYLDEQDLQKRKKKVEYFLEHMPVFRVTFDFEDRLTYSLLNGYNVRTKFDASLVRLLSRYTWYANIIKYNFNLITNWHDYKSHCDNAWYLNAIIARPQYSKDTLKIINSILKVLNDDEEIYIILKNNKLSNLHNLYYGKI